MLGAVVLWASLPPLDWWPLAWVAPVPWVLLIRRKELAGRRPYGMLTLAGFLFWMAILHWLRLPHPATSIGWVALSFYFAFYLPVFVGLSRVAVHRLRVPVILAAPLVWTGLELARGHLLTGMTMASLGHTQYRWIELIQLSDLAGAYGVSFVVMCVAAALARMLPCDGWGRHSCLSNGRQECLPHSALRACRTPLAIWPLAPALAVLAAALGYGYARTAGDYTSPGPNVALIQGSIDVEMRYDPDMRDRIFREYLQLSQEAVRKYERVDLVVWPETMFLEPLIIFDAGAPKPPQFEGTEEEFRKWLPWAREHSLGAMAQTAQSLDVPLILGVDANHLGADGVQCFNSAVYVARDGKLLGRYDKMHLVMFGEYVPLAEYFPWLYRLTPLPGGATPGKRPAAFDLDGVRLAPNICYESVLPHVIRRQVNMLTAEGQQPDILVNLTNDGWFWGSSELDLHLVCGVFRAVECRKPFLIAANTGFSAWIDGDGRIQKQGLRRAADAILAEVRLDRRTSWYLEHGDWAAGICLVGCLFFGLVGLCRGKGTGPCFRPTISPQNAASRRKMDQSPL
jgi:apolipoprotein N-acyltransferase